MEKEDSVENIPEKKDEKDKLENKEKITPEKRVSPTLLLQQILDTLNKLDSKVMVLMGKLETLEKELNTVKNDKIQNTLQSLTAALLADISTRFSSGQTQVITPSTPQVPQYAQTQQSKKSEPAIEEEELIKPSKIFRRT